MEKTKDSVAKATIFDKIKAGISNIIHWAIVASPWIVLVAILPVFFVTHYTRVHQVAITASYACTAIALIVFFGMYIEGNSYKAFSGNRKKPKMAPFNMLLILLSVAMFFMFIPVYDSLEGTDGARTFFLSIHNTIRLYVVDADYGVIKDYLAFEEYTIHGTYATVFSVYAVIMFVVAPFMTAGFVLSFIKDAWAQILYVVIPGGDKTVYYMSELNSRSIALARDIRRQEAEKRLKRSIIVFFDVYHEQNEEHHELMTRASSYGAICFRKDISATGLVRWRKSRKFFFIGENEEENVKQAITLVDRCRESLSPRCNAEFYVFTTASDSEQLIDAIDRARPNAKRPSHQKDFKIRRVDVTRNLAISTVEENYKIFPNSEATEVKQVDIVIVGVGDFGTELLKAYCWASQLPNCQAVIHILDKDESFKSRLEYQMPELMYYSNDKNNRKEDTNYIIDAHEKVDVTLKEFEDKIRDINRKAKNGIDIVFVALGNDELNVKVANDIRRVLGREELEIGTPVPPIQAVVYSTRKSSLLKNESGIEYIGSIIKVYSYDNVVNEENERQAIVYHEYWAKSSCKGAWDDFVSDKIADTVEEIKTDIKSFVDATEPIKEIKDKIIDKCNAYVDELSSINKSSIGDFNIRTEKMTKKELEILEKCNKASIFENLAQLIDSSEPVEQKTASEEPKSEEPKSEEEKRKEEKQREEARAKKREALLDIAENLAKELRRIPIVDFVVNKNGIEPNRREYDKVEYNRISSRARAVHVAIMEKLGYKFFTDNVERKRMYEHSRWNAFMRGEGYVFSEVGKEKPINLRKTHSDLVVYSKLNEASKEKDSVYDFMSEAEEPSKRLKKEKAE